MVNPKSLNEIEIQYEGVDYAIEKFLYYNELNFVYDKSFIKKDKMSNSLDHLSIDFNPDEDILIKKDFIISVINSDILNDLNIPIMCVSIIRQSDFIQNNS